MRLPESLPDVLQRGLRVGEAGVLWELFAP